MEEVSNVQILQAITELSQALTQTEKRLNDTIDNAEERFNQKMTNNAVKIEKVDAKLSTLSDGLLYTQAEVQILKNAK